MILSREPAGNSRWVRAAILVTVAHGLVAAAFFVHVIPRNNDDMSAAIAVDMAPAPIAPPAPRTDDRPSKPMVQAPKAPPVTTLKTKPLPFETPPEIEIANLNPEVVVPKKVDEAPSVAKPLPPAPETAQETSPNTTPDKKMAAPITGGVATGKPTAADIWKNKVRSRILLTKSYPYAAQNLGQEDTVKVVFLIDRSGRLLSARIEGSKGFPMLDRSAIEAVRHAAPFPKPPAEIAGDPIEIPFDLEYYQRDLMRHRTN